MASPPPAAPTGPVPDSSEFAYIVVGAGTAGCVLAARLSADPGARVLLVEAGTAQRTRAMTVPAAWPGSLGSAADWADVTTPQAQAGPVSYPRGKALGGSGAINALAHLRGHRAVYDQWAAGGAAGWGYADLLPYFRRSEQAAGRDPELRGTAGPIRVAPVPSGRRHPVARALAGALAQTGCPVTDDLSGAAQEGVAWADLAIAGGQRTCSAGAYLTPALSRANLVVEAGCVVTGLDIQQGRCAGIRYLRGGQLVRARATGEVILSAGAVGSPRLLLLSGIGPAGHLRAAGIDVVADVPAVGEHLQDHPAVMACYALPGPLPPSGYNHGEVYAALRSSRAGTVPDLHLFPLLLPHAPAGYPPPEAGFALVAAVTGPDSRGTVRLACSDPRHPPVIDPGFLRERRDLDALAEGLDLARQAAASTAFARIQAAEVWPGPDQRTPAGLRSWIRHTVASYYHPAGTCRIGTSTDTVVDPHLRVHGLEGLRVADASVMPVIPNAPLSATVLAIAEKAADLITRPPPA